MGSFMQEGVEPDFGIDGEAFEGYSAIIQVRDGEGEGEGGEKSRIAPVRGDEMGRLAQVVRVVRVGEFVVVVMRRFGQLMTRNKSEGEPCCLLWAATNHFWRLKAGEVFLFSQALTIAG